MKAQIMLCIYHELTHYLVRSIQYFNLLGSSRKSFDERKKSVGISIFSEVKKYFYWIPEYLEAKYEIYKRDPAEIFD